MNANLQTLLTLAELSRDAHAPDSSVRRLNLVPDYLAGGGRLRLFRQSRLAEVVTALAARKSKPVAMEAAQ